MVVSEKFLLLLILMCIESKPTLSENVEIKRVYKTHIRRKECSDLCKRQTDPSCGGMDLYNGVCVLKYTEYSWPKTSEHGCSTKTKTCPKPFDNYFAQGTPKENEIFEPSCYMMQPLALCQRIQAVKNCQHYQSRLVAIETEAEQAFIQKQLVHEVKRSYWTSGYKVLGNWLWQSTGEIMKFRHWAENEAREIGVLKRCMLLCSVCDYKWRTSSCNMVWSAFICERSPV